MNTLLLNKLFSKALFTKMVLTLTLVLGATQAWGDYFDDNTSQSYGKKICGTSASAATDRIPIKGDMIYTQSESVYLASEIGLDNGTKIAAITYRGYRTYNKASFAVKVWMENTNATTCTSTTTTFVTPDDQYKVFDGTCEIDKVGASGNYVDLMTLIFDEPFEYTGNSIRIILQFEETTSTPLKKSTWFERTANYTSYYRTANDLGSLPAGGTNYYKPLICAIYEKDPSSFSGVFAIKKLNGETDPIEGATLTLTNGSFVYSGTTAADGTFNFDVIKDDRTYTLTTDYSDKKYVPFDNEVTFEGSNIEKNLTLEEVEYFYINNINAPTGVVNNTITVTADATNYSDEDISAGSYSATLYVAGEPVATANAVAIDNEETKNYSFQFIPHISGEQTAYIVFSNGDKSSHCDNFTIDIDEEFARGDIQVLDFNTNNYSSPIYSSYKYNYSSTVYTSEKIGLPAGARITNFAFLSRKPTATEVTQHVRIWIENTTDANTVKKADPTGMRLIYETDKVVNHGSYNVYTDNFSADLSDNPFVYTGNNIRVVVQSERTSTTDIYVYFQLDDSYKVTYGKYTDSPSGAGDDAIRGESWKSTAQASPVISMTVANSYIISGDVTDDSSNPISGATVKAQSGEVYYTTTTNSDGEYELPVVQIDKTYTLTAEATGLIKYTENNISLTSDIVRDIELSDKEKQVITTAGMATFVSDYDLDYSSVVGMKAYKAKVAGTSVDLTPVTTVPAGEGVLLMATSTLDKSTTFSIPQAAESVSPWAESDNDFIRGTGGTLASTDGEYNYYILNVVGGVVNFYRANSQKVGTNRAYLRTPVGVASARLSLNFEDDTTTAIKDTFVNKSETTFFNLQGQQIAHPQKGLYVTGGHKVIIK